MMCFYCENEFCTLYGWHDSISGRMGETGSKWESECRNCDRLDEGEFILCVTVNWLYPMFCIVRKTTMVHIRFETFQYNVKYYQVWPCLVYNVNDNGMNLALTFTS